ncbi:PTS glucose transporter subunit IIA [Luteococcus sp. H138]|uniref:PTS sugar transporter subunit IIA n=1 Tax=unclassified Luteococcus TaxID=2639923 RepID=UPI00313B5E0A
MTSVLAPVAGTVRALTEVSDPVFAAEMVGSGAAIEPQLAVQEVIAPIAGKLLKVHPHAFVIHDGRIGVLVHIGIDTVRLKGDGFTVKVTEKDAVEAGQTIVEWDPQVAVDHQMDPVVLVCQMDTAPGSITSPLAGGPVARGEELFTAV